MKIQGTLKKILEDIKPDEKEIKKIKDYSTDFLKKFNSNAKKLKINAEAFVGGSFAKETVIRKELYDVDIFIRFNEEYDEEKISGLTEKILRSFIKNFKKIHGSRDYFQVEGTKVPFTKSSFKFDSGLIKASKVPFTKSSFKLGVKLDYAVPKFCIELIPVIKIKNPGDARNVTDLSYSHVKYINKKVKGKINDEILLAKAFCYANRCYGAESYISGFSGYALELLICYYKSFLNMIKAVVKVKKEEKLIIDIEKKYKNRNMIMMDVNDSKLKSPVILIDPTFKQRNVAAALSNETFEKLKKVCVKFLKNPSEKYFLMEKIDFGKLMEGAKKKKYECILLKVITNKQEGDIAGSKLMKFYNHFAEEISRFFEIKYKEFEYENNKSAKYFFSCKNRREILLPGPFTNQTEAIKQFKKAHRKTFAKKGRIYAKEKINFSLKRFVENWKKKNDRKMKEMSIKKLEVVD